MSHQMVAIFNSRLPFLSNWSFNKAFDGQIHGGRHLQVRGTYEISNYSKMILVCNQCYTYLALICQKK